MNESTEKPDLEEVLRRVVIQGTPAPTWRNVSAGVAVAISVIASVGGWFDNASRIEAKAKADADWKPTVDAKLGTQAQSIADVSVVLKDLVSRMNNVEVTSRVLEKSFDSMSREMQQLRDDVRRPNHNDGASSEKK